MNKTPLTDAAAFSEDGAASEVVTADFARKLETDRAELVEAISDYLDELRWFVSREIDLSAKCEPNDEKKWAEVLDEDADPLRALLARLEADK